MHVCLFAYALVGVGSESLSGFKETLFISIAEQIDNLSDSDSWLNRRRFTDITGFALTLSDYVFLCNLTNATRAISICPELKSFEIPKVRLKFPVRYSIEARLQV